MSDTILQNVHRFLVQLAATMVVAVAVVWWLSLDPRAFRNVEILETERRDNETLFVHARYQKTQADCTYVRGIAYVVLQGDRQPTTFDVMRGAGQTAQREPGIQHMRVEVDLNGWANIASAVEFWTWHHCEGREGLVPRKMWTVEVN